MKFPWFLMSRTSPYSMTILILGFLVGPPAQAQTKPEKNPDQLKIALINIKSLYSDGPDMTENQKIIQTNLKRHLYFLEQAVNKEAEFVGFPELSLNGYRFRDKMTLAEPRRSRSEDPFKKRGKKEKGNLPFERKVRHSF